MIEDETEAEISIAQEHSRIIESQYYKEGSKVPFKKDLNKISSKPIQVPATINPMNTMTHLKFSASSQLSQSPPRKSLNSTNKLWTHKSIP